MPLIRSLCRALPGFRSIGLLCLALMLSTHAYALPQGATASTEATPVRPIQACANLARVDLIAIGGAGSRVTNTTETTGVEGQPVCAVRGTLAPAVNFAVELPTRSWTGRYLQTGCGGLCGHLSLQIGAADGCPAVKAGKFVVASTDMGHEGNGGEFGRDAQRRADFAYRGVHLTAMAAKKLIRAFYGQAARAAYFSGCSDGGREALIEAERFPDDFDGIIAGAPAMNFVVQNSLFHAWQARSNTGPDGRAVLLASRLPILHAAVLKACDGLDGTTDGLVSEPGECRFDVASTVCRTQQDPATCLTPAEAEAARRFYDGPRDPQTGERLTQGGPQFGSELEWAGVYVPRAADEPIFSAMIANASMANLIFPDGQPATTADVRFDRATFDRLRARHPLFDATDPDLSRFAARGGKLILFHGWADPHISPLNTIGYHRALGRQLGIARVAAFERLYLMPGMAHCAGGEGPSAVDLLSPLIAWVERGTAPVAIVVSTPAQMTNFGQPGDGKEPREGRAAAPAEKPTNVARSRPVYPYPYIAAYTGRGDLNAAENWERGRAVDVKTPDWAGSDFYHASQKVPQQPVG